MGSLAQKVDTLREQLGLVDGRPLAASIDEAVFQLGLADQVKGFNLVQKADACLTALGTSSASAAAAAVAPSASAAAESVVLMGLPAGADQAPIAQKMGRAAEELGTYTQPAVAPAPQPIAAPEPLQAKPELNPKSNPNPNPSPGPNPSPSTPPPPRPTTQPHAHPNRSHAPLGGSRSSSTASNSQVYLPISPYISLYLPICISPCISVYLPLELDGIAIQG